MQQQPHLLRCANTLDADLIATHIRSLRSELSAVQATSMNTFLRERAAQDHLDALYAQAKAAANATECRRRSKEPGRWLSQPLWSLWTRRWGLSVVLHHQG